jgi:Tfp pilus assembly protein PilP
VARRCRLAASAILLGLVLAAPTIVYAEAASADAQTELLSFSEVDSILGREHFYYSGLGKRDPFASLLSGDFQQSGPDGLVDIDQVKLVGVMWGETDRFALVEDGDGYSYILREGDRVRYGTVMRLEEHRLVAQITFFGMTRTVVLSLESE